MGSYLQVVKNKETESPNKLVFVEVREKKKEEEKKEKKRRKCKNRRGENGKGAPT
ncbi:MAG: hypothetical protein ACPLTR_10690 [Thermacetogeniaceae bacterium]